MSADGFQACVACGQDTAAGKPLFVGRRAVPADSGTSYLCAACNDVVTKTRRGKRLTDDQVRRLVETGAMGAYLWSGSAHVGGINMPGD